MTEKITLVSRPPSYSSIMAQNMKRCLSPQLGEDEPCKKFTSPPASPSYRPHHEVEDYPSTQALEDPNPVFSPTESESVSGESGYESRSPQLEAHEIQESQEIHAIENEEESGNDDVVVIGRPNQEMDQSQPLNPQAGSAEYRRTPPPFTGLSTAGDVDAMLLRGQMRYTEGSQKILEFLSDCDYASHNYDIIELP